MRVAVYDRYWPTAGGGERFAAGIAEALAGDHEVVLFAHEPLDLAALGARLHVDLTGVRVELVGTDPLAVEAASEHVDLFVNASYTSRERNRARRGIYVVHFPGPSVAFPRWARPLVALGRRIVGDDGIEIDYGTGFHEPEWLLQRQGTWAAPEASLTMTLPPGRHRVMLTFARMPPGDIEAVTVTALARHAGAVVADGSVVVSRGSRRRRVTTLALEMTTDDPTEPVEVTVEVRPSATVGGRQLGVPLVGVQVERGWRARARAAYPLVTGSRRWSGFTASYDTVVANSQFTRRHVEERWHTDAVVLEPPVTMHAPGDKAPVIVNVGRFFPPSAGHSKKQLTLVEAFATLCGQGLSGWELHLVGGVDDAGRSYLDEVRAAAEGLPVVLHPNAAGDELAELYRRASLYWHAAGFGEDAERHPDRLEHFGISTVEAASAGAVPVVYGAGGQLEVVDHGRTGLHWHTVDELVAHTAGLIADGDRRARLGAAAASAAQRYNPDTFGRRVRALVDRLDA